MPNTGLFYLYEVVGNPSQATQTSCSAIESVRAECLACHHVFWATEAPALINISGGGAALICPKGDSRQAISGARFADFVARFPVGNYGEASTDSTAAAARPELPADKA